MYLVVWFTDVASESLLLPLNLSDPSSGLFFTMFRSFCVSSLLALLPCPCIDLYFCGLSLALKLHCATFPVAQSESWIIDPRSPLVNVGSYINNPLVFLMKK